MIEFLVFLFVGGFILACVSFALLLLILVLTPVVTLIAVLVNRLKQV